MATWKTVQKICTRLPEVEESTSYGTPAMKVKGTLFARLRDDDGGLVVWTDEKAALLAEGEPYYTTPHYDGHPSVLLRLPKTSETLLRELLTESWRLRAPAKVRKDNPDI